MSKPADPPDRWCPFGFPLSQPQTGDYPPQKRHAHMLKTSEPGFAASVHRTFPRTPTSTPPPQTSLPQWSSLVFSKNMCLGEVFGVPLQASELQCSSRYVPPKWTSEAPMHCVSPRWCPGRVWVCFLTQTLQFDQFRALKQPGFETPKHFRGV